MNYSDYRFTLDVQIHQAQVSVPVTFGDTARRLCIGLTDGRKPYTIPEECVAVFNAKKPDGTSLKNACIIERNAIIYEFTEQTTNCEGIVRCDITLYDAEGKVLTTPQFIIVVDKRVVNNEEISLSADEHNALNAIYAQESQRKENENDRKTAEKSRASKENARVSAEQTRVAHETERINAENARVSNEIKRDNAEQRRVDAENSRVDAENARVSQENVRINAEQTRVDNENARIFQEGRRASAEESRENREAFRIYSEERRVAVEEARINAEKARTDNENQRNSNYAALEAKVNSMINDKIAEVDAFIGDIDADISKVLDAVIEHQNSLIGGDE